MTINNVRNADCVMFKILCQQPLRQTALPGLTMVLALLEDLSHQFLVGLTTVRPKYEGEMLHVVD